jgi:hypothetical protein
MYLNVILTIFVVLQITTIVLIYKWWDKYGRNLYKSFSDVKRGFSPQTPNSMGVDGIKGPNIFGNIPDMSEMMKQLESMTKNMGKFK